MTQIQHSPSPRAQHRQTADEMQNPFSLAPAIFTPWDPYATLDLPAQQDAVRRNMLSLAHQHAATLIARAREELAALPDDGTGDEAPPPPSEERAREEQQRKDEIAVVMANLEVPVKEDAKSEDYEVKPGDEGEFFKSQAQNTLHASPSTPPRRTASFIREELALNLRRLIDKSVRELEAFDVHARKQRKAGSVGNATGTGLKGILKKKESGNGNGDEHRKGSVDSKASVDRKGSVDSKASAESRSGPNSPLSIHEGKTTSAEIPMGPREILKKKESGKESRKASVDKNAGPSSPNAIEGMPTSAEQIFANARPMSAGAGAGAGAAAVQPVRTFESIGDVARRGSK